MTTTRILAVDPGGRKMGLALATLETAVATPLAVVAYEGCRSAAVTVFEIAAQHQSNTVVIGLPTNAEGEETPACRRSHALAERLAETGLHVVFQSEHLSTHEARSRARELGRARNLPVDDLAAQVILEDYLACQRRSETGT